MVFSLSACFCCSTAYLDRRAAPGKMVRRA
jgi:hypothetical protein